MKIPYIPNNMANNCFGARNKIPGDFVEQRGHQVRYENDFQGYIH
jgi:hypothetical protein